MSSLNLLRVNRPPPLPREQTRKRNKTSCSEGRGKRRGLASNGKPLRNTESNSRTSVRCGFLRLPFGSLLQALAVFSCVSNPPQRKFYWRIFISCISPFPFLSLSLFPSLYVSDFPLLPTHTQPLPTLSFFAVSFPPSFSHLLLVAQKEKTRYHYHFKQKLQVNKRS